MHFHENWAPTSNGEIAPPIQENMDHFDMLLSESTTYKVILSSDICNIWTSHANRQISCFYSGEYDFRENLNNDQLRSKKKIMIEKHTFFFLKKKMQRK